MNQAKPQNLILQQGLALDDYLRTLLEDIPEAGDEPRVEPPKPRAESAPPRPLAKRETEVQPEILKKNETVLVQPENPAKLHALAVMPEWTRHEFQALFFKVDQLILAAPLVDLARTIKLERKPGKIPGSLPGSWACWINMIAVSACWIQGN